MGGDGSGEVWEQVLTPGRQVEWFGMGGDGGDGGSEAADAAVESADIYSDAAIDAAKIQAGSQKEALDYLKEREELPQKLREGALISLGRLQGFGGEYGDQEKMIQRSIDSPLYQSIIEGKEAGEEAILRSASATGGLRSGDTSYNLYDYNTRLQNSALLASYNEQLMGLQGLAGLPSNSNTIASSMEGIGVTKAGGTLESGRATSQGITAAAQANIMAEQAATNNLMGLASLGISAVGAFSDRRLKSNIKKVGTVRGFNFYSFDWNSVANMLGLEGSTYGCMADEVFQVAPKAVTLRNNFMFINYSAIGVL